MLHIGSYWGLRLSGELEYVLQHTGEEEGILKDKNVEWKYMKLKYLGLFVVN